MEENTPEALGMKNNSENEAPSLSPEQKDSLHSEIPVPGKASTSKKWLLIAIVIITLLFVARGVYLLLGSASNISSKTTSVSPTATP